MLPIGSKHIVAYSHCSRKAFLMLSTSEPVEPSEYEQLLLKFQNWSYNTYCKNLPNSLIYEENILKKGFESIQDCKIELKGFIFESKLLVKRKGISSLGKFIYEPVIFLGTNQIAKENRLELAFLGFLLEKIQTKFPEKGVIIDKNGGKHQVELSKLKKNLKTAITEIQDFEKNPPKLFLNRHCPQCPFENLCKNQALKEDNLSLLNRITPKQINKLEKKGIFTITQLSYIYKPRRKSKRVKNATILFKPELQALAIRTQKTYIQILPILNRKNVELFLDIEGLPNENFFYLFGVLISDSDSQNYYSFWAENKSNEITIWEKTIQFIESYPESPIYHYGNFEPAAFDKLAKRYSIDIEGIKNRFVNINSFIYGKIYFPTYSNGLKDLGKLFGANWSNKKASGLQTIIWRNAWDEGQQNLKPIIQTYNEEDCLALKILTDELTRIQTVSETSNDIEFVQNPKRIVSEVSQGIHNQFKSVFQCSYSFFEQSKIKFNVENNEIIFQNHGGRKGFKGQRKKMPKPTKIVKVANDEYCFKHNDQKLRATLSETQRFIIDVDFIKNGVRKSIIKYVGGQGYCSKCNRNYSPAILRQFGKHQLYGYNYKAWIVFQRIQTQLPYEKIIETISEIIKDEGNWSYIHTFIKEFSLNYANTEIKTIKTLLKSPVIYADETPLNIRGTTQYAWIFTDGKHVIFRHSVNRESQIAKDFLKEYSGVLISDFFAGYDSINCPQQKCWVHFLRDLNNALWDNPFDKEYENFVSEIRNLIVPIIQVTHKHGLKKYFLSKFRKNVDKFYKNHIDYKTYKSELCNLYQKRFIRYRNSLFTFIEFNGVNWHNNTAELGIRHICKQRSISGYFHESLTPHYLRLVGIMQTCRFQNKSFLKFLLSKEIDIDNFNVKRKKVIC